jgi:hypothetical protein
VLDNALQQQKLKGKWHDRSRVGIYLGRSPFHACTVALVLNLVTGRVSPQFHVQFDPSFQTVKNSFGGKSPPSLWQSVCGFGGIAKSSSAKSGCQSSHEPRTGADVSWNLNSNRGEAGPTPDNGSIPRFDFNTEELELEGGFYHDKDSVGSIPDVGHEPVLDHTDVHIDDHTDEDATV